MSGRAGRRSHWPAAATRITHVTTSPPRKALSHAPWLKLTPPRLEPLLLPWPDQPLGPDTDLLLALEGKHVRRSGGRASASAGGQPSQRVPATVPLQKHDRAIIAVRQWLEKTEFTGQLLALDWLPTQPQTLPPILYDHGADYLVPLKENPKTLLATAQTLLPEPLCPSGGSAPPPLPG